MSESEPTTKLIVGFCLLSFGFVIALVCAFAIHFWTGALVVSSLAVGFYIAARELFEWQD